MKRILAKSSPVLGYAGILVCLLAVFGRFYGEPRLMGYQAIDIFVVGVGLVVIACFTHLESR